MRHSTCFLPSPELWAEGIEPLKDQPMVVKHLRVRHRKALHQRVHLQARGHGIGPPRLPGHAHETVHQLVQDDTPVAVCVDGVEEVGAVSGFDVHVVEDPLHVRSLQDLLEAPPGDEKHVRRLDPLLRFLFALRLIEGLL
eukprot:CAMPEP_0175301330 /NCGR_PEP_ID=MMETSP0093-20121207/61580_1 /TAXON_ID=311494 /ORGANISM="Alexandrium monilatum, Strain CCMP3105" /LENGTH=139 /DNA_ID=CAMNT_0016597537 /DNA_START=324 /DNA_END=744 /DNA_ORIENTATION=+